ncbi:MAG: hypothetical protein FWE89_01985 [Syntrophaceae bacterium]|nr:hypothetical protein [Syntrophaceae bacterium]
MERIEEFSLEGKSFVYLDLSGVKTNNEFLRVVDIWKQVIKKYPENSIYTVTNVSDIRADSETKKMLTDLMAHNKPYVKNAAAIGFDGIKKIMANTISKGAGRPSIHFALTKEKAIEWLLSQE